MTRRYERQKGIVNYMRTIAALQIEFIHIAEKDGEQLQTVDMFNRGSFPNLEEAIN